MMTMKVCSACALHLVQDATGQTLFCTGCDHTEPGPGSTNQRSSPKREAVCEEESVRKVTEVTERGRRLVTGPPSSSKQPLKALQVDFPTTNHHPIPPSIRSPIEPKPSLLDPIPSLSANRVSSSSYDSLYPGALFEGIQTNKTKEHRVSVRIVDINLQHSTLSGFLTIHDLTDQHPEITTFFDGQIIGDTHGFVTNDWGASEKVDMTHWQRFSPFPHLHSSELVKPRLTLKHPSGTSDRGVLFMRWKEQFLVPDHRVRSINGASYAGFYYICVELGSLMGALHSDALERPAPVREDRENDEVVDEVDEMDTEMSLAGSGRGARSRSRRSVSRNSRLGADASARHPSAPTVRIPDSYSAAEEDKSAYEYGYGLSPYGTATSSSSVTPTAYASSTSPVTGANRIRRASGATGSGAMGARRRRLSIYTAGSVQAQMMDHSYSHANPYAHEIPPHTRGPMGPSTSASYLQSGYGVGPPRSGEDGEEEARREGDDEIMALEDALALDPIAERESERTRVRERMMDPRRRHAISRERYAAESTEVDHGYGFGYPVARKGAGWTGGGPARLTGYYYHSERDHCDLSQKLELHHVPERTRGSFEFR